MALKPLTRLQTRFFQFDQWAEPLKMGRSVLLTSLALTALTLGLRQLGWLQGQELANYDQFIQLQPDEGPDKRLLVVGVTETDLQTLAEWPLSDRTVATLLQKLEAAQPRAIGLDIVRDIPFEPGRQTLLQQLQQSQRLVAVCKVSTPNDPGIAPPPGLTDQSVGFADLIVDAGGTLRRSLLIMDPPTASGLAKIRPHYCSTSTKPLISLSLQTVLKYLAAESIPVGFTAANEMRLGSKVFPRLHRNIGGYRNADAEGYQLMLRYRSEERAVQQVSALDILENKVPAELIRDRIVFVGYTTPLVKDDFYTSYSGRKQDRQKMPGVIVHAQSASQLLAAVLDGRSLIWVWPWSAEVAWIWVWAVGGGIVAWYLRHPLRLVLVMATVSGVIYGLCFLVFMQGGWIPLVPSLFACVGSAVGVVLFDRFNNSAYGQAVYQKVKTFLKLEVEIDETKLEQQVAEITESDYFKDLQDTVKTLRSPSDTTADTTADTSDVTTAGTSDVTVKAPPPFRPPSVQPHPPATSVTVANPQWANPQRDDNELDFLRPSSPAAGPGSPPPAPAADALDFLRPHPAERQRLPSDPFMPPAAPGPGDDIGDEISGAIQLNFWDQLLRSELPMPAEAPPPLRPGDAVLSAPPKAVAEPDDEFDFLHDLKQESQRLKEDRLN